MGLPGMGVPATGVTPGAAESARAVVAAVTPRWRSWPSSIVAAINRADRIVRIDPSNGDLTTIAEGSPLDFPATVALEADGAILVTSFALDGILSGGEAAPALVRVKPRD